MNSAAAFAEQLKDCCNKTTHTKITTASPLHIYERPSEYSKAICGVPVGKQIEICAKEIWLNDVAWVQVNYYDLTGFIKLSALYGLEQANVIIPDLWHGEGYPLGKVYYQLVQKVEENLFALEPMKLKTKVFEYEGQADFVIGVPARNDKRVFILDGLMNYNEELKGRLFQSRLVLPGECIPISLEGKTYLVFASGSPIQGKEHSMDGTYDELIDYQLYIQGRDEEDSVSTTLLYSGVLSKWNEQEYIGGARLEFAGDLDGDGYVDLVLNESIQYGEWESNLLVSPTAFQLQGKAIAKQ